MRTSLATWMVLAIALVALVAYWDARRESAAGLADFADEQVSVARAVSVGVADRARAGAAEAAVAGAARAVEQPGTRLVLLSRPGDPALLASDGTTRVRDATIEAGLAGDTSWVRLPRDAAAALGLPERTAIAGFAHGGGWGVVVVTSALRERDREIRVQWRAVLGVLLAAGLVLAFGGLALRKQRKELDLARELAIAAAMRERDERLARADKLATLGAMATGVAHEVSTPLGVIAGRAEQLLPRVESDERARRATEAILEQTRRIEEVIRGFLGLARGRTPPFVHVDPTRLARTAADLVEHRFSRAGVLLELESDAELPRVACEPRLFEQVLANLLLNACEACDDGGRVTLRVTSDGERVAFVVTDDGAGISPEDAARATEPFFTTKPEGTGLGLALSNEIVKHHNGRLEIAPRPNRERGTRVCVELPAAKEGSA